MKKNSAASTQKTHKKSIARKIDHCRAPFETHNCPPTFSPNNSQIIEVGDQSDESIGRHHHQLILSVGTPNTAIGGLIRDFLELPRRRR